MISLPNAGNPIRAAMIVLFILIPNASVEAGEFYPNELGGPSLSDSIGYYNPLAAEKILAKINAKRTKTPGIYKRRGGPDKVYYLRFGLDSIVAESSYTAKVLDFDTLKYVQIEKGSKFFSFGFETFRGTNIVGNHPIRIFLNSAYLQEIDPNYLDLRSHLFISLPEKSDKEFWKRNLIHMGYGAQYVYKDNPFTFGGSLAIGFGYLWDTFSYFMIIAGPIIGKNVDDKVAIPIIGLCNTIIWKTLFNGWVVKSHMNEYNNLVRSGYRIPRYVISDTLESRFEELSGE